MWKKRLQILLWCLLGFTCVVLLVAAMHDKDRKACGGMRIDMDNMGENVFVDTNEIAAVLKNNNAVAGVEVENIPLGLVEKELEKNAWIKDAQLFFDNNQLLTVKIVERQPVARVFTQGGRSFYIDSTTKMLPLSERHTARVPVFTSFPAVKDTISGVDSMVLRDVKSIAEYIQGDSFWIAQVSQVDITPQHTYQIIPVLGDQLINLGTADELDTKFKKLFAFYKQVWGKTGFEKYEKIDVQYEGQVVAVKRGVVLPAADSSQHYPTGMAAAGGAGKDSLPNGPRPRVTRSGGAENGHRPQKAAVVPGAKGQKPVKRNGPGKPGAKPGKGKKPRKPQPAGRN